MNAKLRMETFWSEGENESENDYRCSEFLRFAYMRYIKMSINVKIP